MVDRSQAVTVAYVHEREVTYSWHHSMVQMIGWDMANSGRILAGGYIAMHHGTGGLVEARNKTVADFLADGKADWLFWVDTDMGFEPDTVDRLLEAADPVERPVVGGLCFIQRETAPDGLGGWRTAAAPTVFDWVRLDDGQMGWAVRWDVRPNMLTRVGGTGSACVLIHRSVFETIEKAHGRAWYDRVPNTSTGQLIGEDLSFCLRAGALQIPIYVHTGVRTSHLKPVWLSEHEYARQQAPIPARAEAAVIVPVMRRPQNAAVFMASLRASTGMATVYAVAHEDDADTIGAWRDAGARVLTGDVTTFAEKVNLAYRETDEPWLFLTGDDVRFHPGWLDHAQQAAGDRYHVAGTNDLGNPRVLTGDHATHLLIRRSYVDEVGASWDGPKVVAHEGYRHWFVDDEIVLAAKERDTWVFAPGSVVEHLHPLWGKAGDDEVYALGQSSAREDRELFERRAREHLGGAS